MSGSILPVIFPVISILSHCRPGRIVDRIEFAKKHAEKTASEYHGNQNIKEQYNLLTIEF